VNSSGPFDIRTPLFREAFAHGKSLTDYIRGGTPAEQKRWTDAAAKIALAPEQIEFVSRFTRRMHVLVLSGLWCGDCVRQCPLLEAVARENELVDLRFIDNEAMPALRDEFRVHGASRVPVAVFLSEDFFEVARFGDRTLSAYRRKFRDEQGASCEIGVVGTDQTWKEELKEWLEVFERAQLLLRLSPMLRKRHGD
jgi:thiol-disulfide isomerase/thioredoxin